MERLFETDSTMEERFGKCPYATAQSLISGKWAGRAKAIRVHPA